jgi:two-component system, response regulator PdtaR
LNGGIRVEYGKFIIIGEDKKVLSGVKNAVISSGHIFIGYSKEPFNILRYVRGSSPDLLIIEVCNNFKVLKPILEVIDEDLLAACVLIVDGRNEELTEFMRTTRVLTYISKPVFDETLLQIVEISLMSYKRMLDYEQKVRKLNDTLESRKVVEKAKWILVQKDGLTETEAYEAIKKKSRDNRMPMREIAEALILTRG